MPYGVPNGRNVSLPARTRARARARARAQAQALAGMDLFDRLQLQAVLGVCRQARSLSEAGRQLFDQSRTQRSVVNDADRLRKYLHKHGLSWERVRA